MQQPSGATRASRRDTLSAIFDPRGIAVVGASSTPTKIGGIPVDFLKRFGYAGRIYPVNPTADRIQDLQAHASIRAIGQPVDLAIFAVPSSMVEAALDDAIAAGVKGVVLFSSGFAEVGGDGVAAQARLGARAAEAGVHLIGPNCLGFMNIAKHVYATFSPAPRAGLVQPGRVGLVSQSGAFGAYAYAMARARGLGLSMWVTTGNEAGLQFADVLEWLADDDNTDVIMGYMEGCRDGPRLRRALALAQARGKPVVMVKVGGTALGAEAAASHTAALAGDEAVYDAVFRRYGVIRAQGLTDFFDIAHAAAIGGRPRSSSVALFTLSGGVGALMADAASNAGLEVPALSAQAQATLRDWVPFSAPRNPVDITGQVTNDLSLMERSARLMLQDQRFGAWVGFFAAAGASDTFWPVLHALMKNLRAEFPETLLVATTLLNAERKRALETLGCLSFDDPSQAIRALASLARPAGRSDDTVRETTPVRLPAGASSEVRSMALLAEAGVPVVPHAVATSREQAIAAARRIGGPVVLKVVSADVPHKSDAGGVVLDVQGDDEVAQAYERILANVEQAKPQARIDGVMVAPMLQGGIECIAGVRRDPVFGPVLVFGLGGVFVETLRDVSLRVLPITRDDALGMARELQAFPLLDGARGRPKADLEALADALMALADFALAAGDSLESAEINPLMAVPGDGWRAVDALVIGAT
ncbi:MAG: acetate--CoA ligase family protein [Rhizobacter sp.]|nr:acetate--CoA ligase family protein [Rhizobacter sp.]